MMHQPSLAQMGACPPSKRRVVSVSRLQLQQQQQQQQEQTWGSVLQQPASDTPSSAASCGETTSIWPSQQQSCTQAQHGCHPQPQQLQQGRAPQLQQQAGSPFQQQQASGYGPVTAAASGDLLCDEADDLALLLAAGEDMGMGFDVTAERTCSSDSSASSCCLDAILAQAGRQATRLTPGQFAWHYLDHNSLIRQLSSTYGFTDFDLALGNTYFQRLASRDPAMCQAAQDSPEYSQHLAGMPAGEWAPQLPSSIGTAHMERLTRDGWLTMLHLTCTYLARKNVGRLPHAQLLRTMLTHIYGQEMLQDHASALEIEVLKALEYRLGPFYLDREA